MIRYQDNGLYNLFLRRLQEIRPEGDYIRFPAIFEKLCPSFSIKKDDCWKVLFFLKDSGAIDVVFGRGVVFKQKKRFSLVEVIARPKQKLL